MSLGGDLSYRLLAVRPVAAASEWPSAQMVSVAAPTVAMYHSNGPLDPAGLSRGRQQIDYRLAAGCDQTDSNGQA